MEDTKKFENEEMEMNTENNEEAVDETIPDSNVEEEVKESKLKEMFAKACSFADKHKGKIATTIVVIGALVIGKKVLGKDAGVQDVIFVDEAKEIVDAVLSEVDAEDVIEAVKSEVTE